MQSKSIHLKYVFISLAALILSALCPAHIVFSEDSYKSLLYTTTSGISASKLEHSRPFNLLIKSSRLGNFLLHVKSLKPHSRATRIGESNLSDSIETLYLGSGKLKVRRGISKNGSNSLDIPTSLSARLHKDNNRATPYLRINFQINRKSGRVYEVTAPIGSRIGRIRSVTLRALSQKKCPHENFLARNPQMFASNNISASETNLAQQGASSLLGGQGISKRVFSLTTDCDFECYTELGKADANDRILEFINTVNNIYGSSLNLTFNVVNQISRNSSDRYPESITSADKLIDLFETIAPSLPKANLKHLITGKEISQNILGASYRGVTCRYPEKSLGFSRHVSSLLTPIIIAHEFGHNLDASHDPESKGIMAAKVSLPSATSFSDFSKNQISSYIGSLENLACYSSKLPENSSAVEEQSASLKARFPGSRVSLQISRNKSIPCAFTLYAAGSESGLFRKPIRLLSSTISSESLTLLSSKMPKIKVTKRGQKALIWLNVKLNCAEEAATSAPSAINVAILSSKAKGSQISRNKNSWINQLRKAEIKTLPF